MQDDASSVLGCWSSSVAKNENFGFRSDLQMCRVPNQTSSKGYLHPQTCLKKEKFQPATRALNIYSSIATVSFQPTNPTESESKNAKRTFAKSRSQKFGSSIVIGIYLH